MMQVCARVCWWWGGGNGLLFVEHKKENDVGLNAKIDLEDDIFRRSFLSGEISWRKGV